VKLKIVVVSVTLLCLIIGSGLIDELLCAVCERSSMLILSDRRVARSVMFRNALGVRARDVDAFL
jgi:hypothetical protein